MLFFSSEIWGVFIVYLKKQFLTTLSCCVNFFPVLAVECSYTTMTRQTHDNCSCSWNTFFLWDGQLWLQPRFYSSTLDISIHFRFTEIPPPVYKLKKLEILFMNDNQVSTIDPAGLQRLGALATLDLQNNNISQVPPELGNCTSIKLVVQKFLSVQKKISSSF